MFIGHCAVGFACKRLAPRASLAVLMAAPWWRVRIDPGNTTVTPLAFKWYPYTHSLLMAVVWSLLLGGLYFGVVREWRAAVVIGLAVLSHWLLDWVVHRPDLPLYPGSSTHAGLGLWNSRAATLAVELPIFALGVATYARVTRPRNRIGSIALWLFVVFVGLVYLGNIFGPPPPSARAVAYVSLALWLFVPWAWWIDRNRKPEAQVIRG